MRCRSPRLAALVTTVLAGACTGDGTEPPQPITFQFDPIAVGAGQELADDCVSVTLDNEAPIYVNAVDLATSGGFHHSNWFWVPESVYPGADGRWRCSDRNYDEALAGASGGVLFAQSTQSVDDGQRFPAGVVIAIPAHAKIVAGLHILNASDSPLTATLALTLHPIAVEDVRVKLAAMALDYEALALPPMRTSSFTVECDLAAIHEQVVGTPLDFSIYYVLPHYHDLGRRLELVATGGPGGDTTIFTTQGGIGEALGRTLEPPFSMAGYQGVRFTCTYDNTTDLTIRYGLGDGEMCVVQAFTDSGYLFGGGALDRVAGTGVDDGQVVAFSHACEMYAFPSQQP